MKTIGLLCGLSWVSTKIYYEIINRRISQELKGVNSAQIIMNSLNANTVVNLLQKNCLEQLEKLLINECVKLEKAGCDFIAITCNTVHAFYNTIQNSLTIPIIHIMDCVTSSLIEYKIKKAGVLGTEFTVKNKLYDPYLNPVGINSIYPNSDEVKIIDNMIFRICSGETPSNQDISDINEICERLKKAGSDAIILGCTELGLVAQDKTDLIIFNSAIIHAEDLAARSIFSRTQNKEHNSCHWLISEANRDIRYA